MGTIAAALATARDYIGTPYAWGGFSKSGIDCSGLVYQCYYGDLDMIRGDTDALAVDSHFDTVSRSGILPGGIILEQGNDSGHKWQHVGLYVGNGTVIHAPTFGQPVREDSLDRFLTWCGGDKLYRNFNADDGSKPKPSGLGSIHLQAETANGVLPAVKDAEDDAGDGTPILWLAAWTDKGVLDVQAHTENGWLPELGNPSDLSDRENGCVGDGTPIDKLKMYWWSPSGRNCVCYRVMAGGSWLPLMRDLTDTGGSSDDFAGILGKPIQRVEAHLE